MVKRTQLSKEVQGKINKLNETYGGYAVRFAIWHLVSVGHKTMSALTNEEIETAYQAEVERQNQLPSNQISMMTPEFMRDINIIARELALLGIGDFLKYVQNETMIQ